MNKLIWFFTIASVIISTILFVVAVDTGADIGLEVGAGDFVPRVWMCDGRGVFDEGTMPGRISAQGEDLVERIHNYAFEGETINWTVLVMDKNKIAQNMEVYATIGSVQGVGGDVVVLCDSIGPQSNDSFTSCNARIDEEELSFDPNTMDFFACTFIVEDMANMSGKNWITVEACDSFDTITNVCNGSAGVIDEHEYWFFNPVIALSVDGTINFTDVLPGTSAYSNTILVGFDTAVGDEESGVMLDMFISGTQNFSDLVNTGVQCPLTNALDLGDNDSFCDVGSAFGDRDSVNEAYNPNEGADLTDTFCYHATKGAYDTKNDLRSDDEGYVGIRDGVSFDTIVYGEFNGDDEGYEILQDPGIDLTPPAAPGAACTLGGGTCPYFMGNVLTPGAEIAITFRVNLPEPCNGTFTSGNIYFWAEAI